MTLSSNPLLSRVRSARVFLLMVFALTFALGCDDVDRAIEAKANEVLGVKPEQPEEPGVAENEQAAPKLELEITEIEPPPQAADEPEAAATPTPEPTPEPTQVEPTQEPAKVPTKPEPATTTKPATQTTKPVEVAVKPAPVPEPKPAPVPEVKPTEVQPAETKPTEVKPAEPAPAPKPASKVNIPQSKHVQVSAPARVQELLNADTRMQPWLNSTMATIENCYAEVRASNASASGTISFVLTMHENSRPDADITSLPPQLSGIVACGTGKLMRAARMPLFTGKEGEKHTVKITFTP